MAHELTQRQQRVVEAIQAWIKEHGLPPTIRELGKQVGIKSLRGVTTHLDALVKKGRLARRRGARGLRLLMGDAPAAVGAAQALRVPIVGRIAAGGPLLAQERLEGELLIDPSVLGKGGGDDAASHPPSPEASERFRPTGLPGGLHFALRVHGRSMQGAGILHGDYVIVRQQPTADNGEIVAALIGEEATVKRFFREDDHIRLQPENPAMEPLLLTKDQPVEILGKVVAVFRQLP